MRVVKIRGSRTRQKKIQARQITVVDRDNRARIFIIIY